jgi:hypothetical protein
VAATARQGIANALATADHPSSATVVRAAQESFVDGWQQAMWAGVAAMTLLVVYVLVVRVGADQRPRLVSTPSARSSAD